MAKKPKFDPRIHDENPEWTDEDLARARPASEVLPPDILAQFENKGGQPTLGSTAKLSIKLRLDSDIVAAYKAGGAGWQTQINADLRRAKKLKAVQR